ncbi:MAG: hypothetical protein R3F31_25480 [Verrucomicrobiales bacterium]
MVQHVHVNDQQLQCGGAEARDTPPTTTPLYQQPTLESFLRPYLDDNGNIKIGPMDVIYLMELTHTDRNNGGFDLQDLVILVTFQS